MSSRKKNNLKSTPSGRRKRVRRVRPPGTRHSLVGTNISRSDRPVMLRNPMPDSWLITCRATDYGFQANTGALFQNIFYKMNNAVNPSDGSTIVMIPFAEYAAFSNSYRVINFRCRTTWMSLESFPGLCITGPSTVSIGNNNSLLIEFSTNQYWRKKAISAKGGMDRATMYTALSLPRYFGSEQYMNDPAFAGTTPSTAPSTLLYFNFGTVSTNAITSGTEYMSQIEMDVLFYKKDTFSS
jgi:hypothetical protein